MMERRRAALVSLAGCLVIALLILFVDRPWALWAHAALHGDRVFVWLTWIVDPLPPAAGLVLLLAALGWLAGRPPGRIGAALIAAAVAELLAGALKDQLKWAFGRPWPVTWIDHDPSWVTTHTYGFFPFHGGAGWASFPSGHTTLVTAPMVVFWTAFPRLRPLWAALVLLVVAGLLGADYHFPGDCAAGFLLALGTAHGIMALQRMGRERWDRARDREERRAAASVAPGL